MPYISCIHWMTSYQIGNSASLLSFLSLSVSLSLKSLILSFYLSQSLRLSLLPTPPHPHHSGPATSYIHVATLLCPLHFSYQPLRCDPGAEASQVTLFDCPVPLDHRSVVPGAFAFWLSVKKLGWRSGGGGGVALWNPVTIRALLDKLVRVDMSARTW